MYTNVCKTVLFMNVNKCQNAFTNITKRLRYASTIEDLHDNLLLLTVNQNVFLLNNTKIVLTK